MTSFPFTLLVPELQLCVLQFYVKDKEGKKVNNRHLFRTRAVCSQWKAFVHTLWMTKVAKNISDLETWLLSNRKPSRFFGISSTRQMIAELASYTNETTDKIRFLIETLARCYKFETGESRFAADIMDHKTTFIVKDPLFRRWLLHTLTERRSEDCFQDYPGDRQEHRRRMMLLRIQLVHCVEQYERYGQVVPQIVYFFVGGMMASMFRYEYAMEEHRLQLLCSLLR